MFISLLPSAKGLSFTLCWVSLPTSFCLRSKHLCQLCALILTCLPIALVILLYVDNYPWDMDVTSWKQLLKLNHPLCCFNAFYFESIALWVTLMQDLLMLVLKVLFMKSLCYMIHLFTHVITIVLIAAFITYAYNSISRLWWHVTPEIIFVIVYLLGTSRN